MMAKKKKTQLKPQVARGFATTSIPKKPTQTEETAPPTSDAVPTVTREPPVDDQDAVGPRSIPPELVVEQDGQQFLQIMVDKHQEKTEKEISRTVKVCS